jgi:hypothetical protein
MIPTVSTMGRPRLFQSPLRRRIWAQHRQRRHNKVGITVQIHVGIFLMREFNGPWQAVPNAPAPHRGVEITRQPTARCARVNGRESLARGIERAEQVAVG